MSVFTPIATTGPEQPGACDACGYGRTIRYNWAIAGKEPESKVGAYRQALEHLGPTRNGDLYGCRSCGGRWFVFEQTACALPFKERELIERWFGSTHVLTAEHFDIARQIGARPIDIYGNGKDSVDVPCEIETANGEVFPAAVVSFQKYPPYEPYKKPVRLASEIVDLRPGKYTLPAPVRIATAQAREISYGFAPTLIETNSGHPLVINGSPHFMFSTKYAAEKTRPSAKTFDRHKMPPAADDFEQEIAYFIADWVDGVEDLRLKIRGQ